MRIYHSVEELIGHTPLLEPRSWEALENLPARILFKMECMNPAGSAKDRVALSMILDAEARGVLTPDSVIIEPTSGNTGIGLASVAAARGYRCKIVMPDTMSIERVQTMQAYGAEVILSDGKLGMAGAIAKAEALAKELPSAFLAGQFENPANAEAHYRTTGPEIYEDTEGKVDLFVASVGTGGTLTGTGRYLKEKLPHLQVVAVEPKGSPFLSCGVAGAHKIQGIGAGFLPRVLDTAVYDRIVTVSDEDAYADCREFSRRVGILVGISSGAVIRAARALAAEEANRGKTVVAVLPDLGARYLSTGVFGDA